MICFDRGEKRFNFRIAGVAIYNNKVLLHRLENDKFWALPGGRNEFFEFSEETLVREMKEELNEAIEVDRLLWVDEEFFEHDDKKYHEISFYYSMNFVNDKSDVITREVFTVIEGNNKFIFTWFDLNELDELTLYPVFIKDKILNLSDGIEHIMNSDI